MELLLKSSFKNYSRLGKISVSSTKRKIKVLLVFWEFICIVRKWAYEMLKVHNHLYFLLSQTVSILHYLYNLFYMFFDENFPKTVKKT